MPVSNLTPQQLTQLKNDIEEAQVINNMVRDELQRMHDQVCQELIVTLPTLTEEIAVVGMREKISDMWADNRAQGWIQT